MRLLNRYRETITDGEGIRYSLYLSGCRHACPGCHNPESWDAEAGVFLSDEILDEILDEIRSNPLLDGITVSGGDPFYDPKALLGLLRRLKESTGLNLWCYTGFTMEYLLREPSYRPCLDYIDVLVDGPFVERLYDASLPFRGSRNQRIIRLDHARPLEGQLPPLASPACSD